MKLFDFRKYPVLFTFLPAAFGIIISYYSQVRVASFTGSVYILILASLALLSIVLYSFTQKLHSLRYYLYFVLVLLYGAFSLQYMFYKTQSSSIYNHAGDFKYSNVNLYGVITDDPDVNNDRIKMIVRTDSLSQSFTSFNYSGTVLLSVYRNKFANDETGDYKAGDRIQINGRLEPLPHRRNPGEFDYGEYLKIHDIEAVFSATGFDKIKKTGEEDIGFFKLKIISPVKSYINNVIDNTSEGEPREFLRGLLLGDKSNISKETKTDFVNAGVAHIIAVSGLNVAYVLIILSGVFILLPIPRLYKNILMILCLLFYMNLTGNSASIVRATIMAIVFLLAQMFERRPNAYNVVSFAALIIVLIDPRQLFDSGFILSFAAILSLVIFTAKIDGLFMKSRWYVSLNESGKLGLYVKNIILLFTGTLAAQLGTLPVTAIMFKKISIVSLIVNMFAIPISNINLALGFITVFVSLVSSWAAMVFAAGNNFLMYYLLKAISFSARLDYSYVETYRMDFLLFVIYYAVIFFLLSVNKLNYKARIAVIVLLIVNFITFETLISENKNARISYLDVGSSNASLISMPGGTNILINAGTSSVNYSSAERNLLPYLKREGISKVDLLIITAIDANELRNLRSLLNGIEVKRILMPVYYKPVFENDVIKKTFAGSNINFIDSSRVINPKGNFRIYLYYDGSLNGPSMLVDFTYGKKHFLFDDAEDEIDMAFNQKYLQTVGSVTSLRVPLYGSFEFTNPEFIAATNPSCIVISSQKNRSKPADTDVFEESLEKAGFKVLNVAERGAVIMETDGERTKMIDWK